MIKKFMVFFTAFLLIFTTVGNVSAAPLFKDVSDKHASKAELDYLAGRGIIFADPAKNFGVNEEITRLEASTLIIKALGLKTADRPDPNFTDVTAHDEGYEIIATIADEGIMNGNEKGAFMPNNKLTRGQMAAILVGAFKLKGTSNHAFKDVAPSYWASESINILFFNEVTTGYPNNTYKPTAFITKANFGVFLARILNPEFKKKPVCYKADSKKKVVVNVQVTNLWKSPNKNRVVDRPSISSPTDIAKWTKGMSVSQKLWLVGKTDTQALYGQEVVILKSSGNWHEIAVKDQYTPRNKAGYPGWVPKSHVTETTADYTDCKIAIVDTNIATLYNEPQKANKFVDISYTTILPVIQEEGEWIHVQTPSNGVKYLRKQDAKIVKNFAAIPKPTQKDIVDSAKMFLGLPYVWSGISGFGFDCSGLIHSVYKNHGIMIPRDSFVQAVNGTPVARKNMRPGDLLFFAYNQGKGKVYHVGMYIGNNQMIHAPNSSRNVEIISIDAHPYKANFAGSRRYLK
ncbi:S-layer homology domain-containing protein [Sporosarcina sp. JAI121]|uniref:S-layer homology domain-containing protein n=1 Tax=Sporosarcina sp. JAI121 TaxID=2723064 RepID=UPI0015CB3038|nr:S-layer homology domain-containing protein [Sporosarcina sp. JAI121]NYF25459.1 cell wall-associated NlpC family hydrolase [Sporosarcina sp. JAI121]